MSRRVESGKRLSFAENKNMPLNRALDFLKCDYHNYNCHLKKNAAKRTAADDDGGCGGDAASEESGDEAKDKSAAKIFKFNKKQKKFLKLLLKPITSASERVKLNDMDRLLTYLSKQKCNLINATLAWTADEPAEDKPANQAPSQPVPLLSMQINPAELTYSQHAQAAQIPSLLSMPYQMPPPPLLNQGPGLAPSLLMHQFQLIPNYGLGLAGPNPGGMSLLGQYPVMQSAPPSTINTSAAPPSLMSIQPTGGHSSSSPAPSLMSVQPCSLMNLSLPNYGGANNSSLLGNPPQGVAYPGAAHKATNNFKQQQQQQQR